MGAPSRMLPRLEGREARPYSGCPAENKGRKWPVAGTAVPDRAAHFRLPLRFPRKKEAFPVKGRPRKAGSGDPEEVRT